VRRLFVAIDLPAEERSRLRALLPPLAGARAVSAEQMHLTLRFLGAVAEEKVADVAAALGAVEAPAFALALAGVGVFPPPHTRKPARVLWAGVTPGDGLAALKAAVDRALGPPEERAFTPHVTLARWRDRPGPELRALLERHRAFTGPLFPVTAFRLYDSRTDPAGAVHTRLRSYPLRA